MCSRTTAKQAPTRNRARFEFRLRAIVDGRLVPFLANDLPFLRDVAEEHGFGVVTDLDKPEAVAAAITTALADSGHYAELKCAAVEAGLRINWELEGKKLLDIYARLMKPAKQRCAA